MTSPIEFAEVAAAAARLSGVAHRTPVLTSRSFDAQVGARVFFKCENLQRSGSFKFRGAYNALAKLTTTQRSRGVVTFSSGNHAQAVALTGRLLEVPTVIVMPLDTPRGKLAATRGYQEGQLGSEIVLYDRFRADRAEIGARLALERGLTLIPPFDHRDVIAGQGTATLELIEQVGPLDALLVCVGGGGLLAGAALASKQLCPEVQLYGVEPELGNDAQQSVACGHIVTIPTPVTIADGAQTTAVGKLTFPFMQRDVTALLTVSDRELVRCMQLFAERMKLVVEPTGCLAAAALLGGAVALPGARVGVLISGGNVDLERYLALVQELGGEPAAAQP